MPIQYTELSPKTPKTLDPELRIELTIPKQIHGDTIQMPKTLKGCLGKIHQAK